MRSELIAISIIATFLSPCMCRAGEKSAPIPKLPQPFLSFIADRLEAENPVQESTEIDILDKSEAILPLTAIGESQLRESADYIIAIRHIAHKPWLKDLVKLIRSGPTEEVSELEHFHSAMIFKNLDGTYLGGFYFGRRGETLCINGKFVKANGELYDWLQKNFGRCFQYNYTKSGR